MSGEGKLADFADLDRIEPWSRQFYEEFKEWAPAEAQASWSTWDPGYLLLELILKRGQELSEPVCIYSADEELTFATRVWHDHSPHWDFPETEAGNYIKALAGRWFAGEFKIVTYYLGDAWKGSITISAEKETRAALIKGINWVRERSDADRVELKGPFKCDDQVFAVGPDGIKFDS